MENIPVSSMVSKQLSDIPTTKNQGPQQKSGNQTLIEKFFINIQLSNIPVIYQYMFVSLFSSRDLHSCERRPGQLGFFAW